MATNAKPSSMAQRWWAPSYPGLPGTAYSATRAGSRMAATVMANRPGGHRSAAPLRSQARPGGGERDRDGQQRRRLQGERRDRERH
jgi:hypothetical protein